MNTNRKQYIKNYDELLSYEKTIVKSYPENLFAAMADGKRGLGKSMWCFITCTRIFQYIDGLSVDAAYVKALDHFLWTTPQIERACDKVLKGDNERDKYRILVLDDAGTHLSKYRWVSDPTSVDDLKGRFDTIRDITSSILINTPSKKGVLAFMREYPDVRDVIINYDEYGDPKYGRIVSIRDQAEKWHKRGKLLYKPVKMSIWVDDWAYDEYKKRKRQALKNHFYGKKTNKTDMDKLMASIKKFKPDITREEIIEILEIDTSIVEGDDVEKKDKDEFLG